MQSKNKPSPTVSERRHIEKIAAMDCCVCSCAGPSEVHEIEQGQWFTSLPLCPTCHRHPVYGWHGQKANWRSVKLNEIGALAVTIRRLMESTP